MNRTQRNLHILEAFIAGTSKADLATTYQLGEAYITRILKRQVCHAAAYQSAFQLKTDSLTAALAESEANAKSLAARLDQTAQVVKVQSRALALKDQQIQKLEDQLRELYKTAKNLQSSLNETQKALRTGGKPLHIESYDMMVNNLLRFRPK